jgi:hypothetical protein
LNRNPLIVYLKEKTNQLDTVNIPNHDLTKKLKIDSESRPRIVNSDSIIADFQRLAKMPSIKTKTPLLFNTDPTKGRIGSFIITASTASIGFKFKDVELRNELRTKRNFPKKIIADFGLTYFTETLKIPRNKVYHFITYCEERNIMQLYKKNELIKILTILEEESNVYLKIEKEGLTRL